MYIRISNPQLDYLEEYLKQQNKKQWDMEISKILYQINFTKYRNEILQKEREYRKQQKGK